MREWNLTSGDPLCLTLTADRRLGTVDYGDDQIWELSLNGGEPPALALGTSYGLRARQMRVFPRFTLEEVPLTDPARFSQPPRVTHFYPSYLQVACQPFSGMDVQIEYWVPDSHLVAARVHVTNQNVLPRRLRMEWAVVLAPLEAGEPMTAVQKGITTVLAGRTSDLAPVLFFTGGPEAGSGPFPSLAFDLELAPGTGRQLTWALAALHSPDASYEAARHATARPWDAEIARIELVNARQAVEITTGDADWDAALAFSQDAAFSLFVGGGPALPEPTFVAARQPVQGHSPRGDGSDYSHLWNGQTALESEYLAGLILPGGADLAKGLVRNFLATQAEDGGIDWKPGPAGQRANLMAQPLLAHLAWRAHQHQEDPIFLLEVYPPLARFFEAWFSPENDRDGDGVPEWEHAIQLGLEGIPLFDRWHEWGEGLDVRSVEGPALCAMLARECSALIEIARALGREADLPALEQRAQALRAALDEMWDPTSGAYRTRDRDTHQRPRGQNLYRGRGPGVHAAAHSFDPPRRLVIHVTRQGQPTSRAALTVKGKRGRRNHEEQFGTRDLVWLNGRARVTTQAAFSALKSVEATGLGERDTLLVRAVGYTHSDLTGLLPLWAQIPSPAQARTILKKSILAEARFGRTFGLPGCLPPRAAARPTCGQVNGIWNRLILEGLLAYGYRAEAADLLTRWMAAIIAGLKSSAGFFQAYDADSGSPSGERGALAGLAPVGLFLEVLGVRILSPRKVVIRGSNPFPWDVTLSYRGLTVLRSADGALVTFPDGQQAAVSGPRTQVVTLE